MTPLLRAEALSCGYGGRPILTDVDLTLRAGELVGLLGRNASGKTTLLRALAGLHPLAAGRVWLGEADASALSRRERASRAAYLPQRRELFYDLSVLEAVLMGVSPGLGAFEAPSARHRETARAALGRLGIGELADAGVLRLSEGQRQLVMLARTLAQDAPVMLFDEPDGALDFVNRHDALGQIAALARGGERAGLATLHDPNLALLHCDRVLMLAGGKIAGAFCPAWSDRGEIAAALSLAYGEIELIEDGGRLLMTRGGRRDGLGR